MYEKFILNLGKSSKMIIVWSFWTAFEYKNYLSYINGLAFFYLKTSSAQFACEWFESGVLPAVSDQVRRLAEGLPAHHALVRFLT